MASRRVLSVSEACITRLTCTMYPRVFFPHFIPKHSRLPFRFFPEGIVLMLTSTDEVQSCVNSLRSRVPRNSSVLIGDYLLHDNCVTLVLKKQESKGVNFSYRRQKKREPVHDSGEQTFHIVSDYG